MDLKQRILHESSQMLFAIGPSAMTMDMVARSCGISKRTLYEIYENKEQLLMDAVKLQESMHLKVINNLSHAKLNTIEWLVEGYRLQMKELSTVSPSFFSDLGLYKNVRDFLYEEHLKRKAESRRFIDEGIREGYFLANLNYEVINNILDAASQYILNANMYKEYGMPSLFHNFVVVFLRGICTQKGIELLDKLMQNVDDK